MWPKRSRPPTPEVELGQAGDHVASLSAPADVLLARIATRTANPYGKGPGERELILQHLATVEPRLRATATVEIDAAAPISEVVQRLEELA